MCSAKLKPVPADENNFVDELVPGTELLHGQYTIKSFLNAGGFGITYLAHDSLERKIVIKECFPGAFCRRSTLLVQPRSRAHQAELASIVRLFVQEARSLSKLVHPNIVGVHQVFEDNNTAYMALDFVEGDDLLERLEGETWKPDPAEIKEMLKKLLGAISFIHSEGMLHRDISPDNILLEKDGNPILIDFGAAREQASKQSRVLSALRVVKDGYSPQEFYIAGSEQSASSDLYALGATFYHVLMGETPPNSQNRLAAAAAGDPDLYQSLVGRVAGYDDNFLSSIDKALAIMPKDRMQTAEDWLAALDGRGPVSEAGAALAVAKTNKAKGAAAPTAAGARPQEQKKSKMALLLGSVAAIAVIGAVVATQTDLLKSAPPSEPQTAIAAPSAAPTAAPAPKTEAPAPVVAETETETPVVPEAEVETATAAPATGTPIVPEAQSSVDTPAAGTTEAPEVAVETPAVETPAAPETETAAAPQAPELVPEFPGKPDGVAESAATVSTSDSAPSVTDAEAATSAPSSTEPADVANSAAPATPSREPSTPAPTVTASETATAAENGFVPAPTVNDAELAEIAASEANKPEKLVTAPETLDIRPKARPAPTAQIDLDPLPAIYGESVGVASQTPDVAAPSGSAEPLPTANVDAEAVTGTEVAFDAAPAETETAALELPEGVTLVETVPAELPEGVTLVDPASSALPEGVTLIEPETEVAAAVQLPEGVEIIAPPSTSALPEGVELITPAAPVLDGSDLPEGVTLINPAAPEAPAQPAGTAIVPPMMSTWSVDLPFSSADGDSTVIGSVDPSYSDELFSGARITSVNGQRVSSFAEIDNFIRTANEPGGDATEMTVTFGLDGSDVGEVSLTLPAHKSIILADGPSFETRFKDGAWQTEITALNRSSSDDLQVGDVLVGYVLTQETVDGRDSLERILTTEFNNGTTTFNFAVRRNGSMWIGALNYDPGNTGN